MNAGMINGVNYQPSDMGDNKTVKELQGAKIGFNKYTRNTLRAPLFFIASFLILNFVRRNFFTMMYED